MSSRAAVYGAATVVAAILVAAIGAAPSAADEPRIEATAVLEPGLIGVGELASFTITVTSGGFGGLDVHPAFELDNLDVAGGPFQSQSQRWVNGTTSSSLQLTWRLRPKGVGPAKVRAIALTVSGQALRLSDKEIQVQQEAPAGRAAPPQAAQPFDPFEDFFGRAGAGRRRAQPVEPERPKLFLRAEVTPATVYVGQQSTYTLWLYTQTDVGAFQPTHLPAFKGFWVREIPQPSELKPEWLQQDGERYGRVAMLRRALFPLQDGKFKIEPTEVDLVARLAEIGPFGTPFGRNETLHLATDPSSLEVLPLPPPPAGFTGAVGELAVSARLDRSTLNVGEAATLTIRSTGRGNLQSLRPPELILPEGLKVFPPRQENAERLTDGTLVSSQEWSYVLVPQRAGNFDLPALDLPYFDPTAKQYQRATTRPLALLVTGNPLQAAPAATSTADTDETSASGKGAAASEKESAAATPAPGDRWGASLLAGRPWLWAVGGGVAVLGLIGAGSALRRSTGSRQPPAGKALAAKIQELDRQSAEQSPRETAAALEEALRHHLETRFDIAPGTPVSQWAVRLSAAKVEPAAAESLAELARELHYLRYAPELAAADALRADAIARARRLARQLK
ncbi:MAG: BatD family protein [Thermoanaerobaculia bacterium]